MMHLEAYVYVRCLPTILASPDGINTLAMLTDLIMPNDRENWCHYIEREFGRYACFWSKLSVICQNVLIWHLKDMANKSDQAEQVIHNEIIALLSMVR